MAPSNVLVMPKIIYGTAWKKEKTAQYVIQAVLQGFRAIDTAKTLSLRRHLTQNREDYVGHALQILETEHKIPREKLFIQTKFTSISGQDTRPEAVQPVPYDRTLPVREQVLQSFQRSLENLHTTYMDSYLLHSPLDTIEETIEAWKVLIALQDAGKVHIIGVSNTYSVTILEALSKVRPVQVVQNRWYEGNKWDKDVCKYCQEQGVMYQSFWTLSGSPRLLTSPTVLALAQRHACTPAQVIFRIAQMNGVIPLSGSKNESRMAHGVEAENLTFESNGDVESVQQLRKLLFD